ncbi:MAG: hypothetical protein PHT30_01685 [Bacilli bacterium]|nr:hypothetical protein [Bacilli bacterium]
MTQEEFDKAPLLDQILYDTTGMLVENHRDIAEAMEKYHQAKVKNLGLFSVSVSESDIDAMFPYEDIETARPTRPENRVRAYNSRQADRREGAKRLLEKLHSR